MRQRMLNRRGLRLHLRSLSDRSNLRIQYSKFEYPSLALIVRHLNSIAVASDEEKEPVRA